MKRGFVLFSINGGNACWVFLLLLFGGGLAGCGSSSAASQATPVICTPQATNANVYKATPASAGAPLIPNGVAPNGVSGVTTSVSAEQALALLQGTPLPGIPVTGSYDSYTILGTLVNKTKSWSDIQTIELDDSNKAQIVVTFLSPQLIQAVFNSEALTRGDVVSNSQSALDEIAARDELIFFVSVITTSNNNINTTPHRIDIPIREMVIMNADGVDASPLHDDHVLAQPINSSFEPVFGYLTYPIAMMHGTQCNWILDPDYNKRIIVTVPNILVDGVSSGPYTWVISYSSLFKVWTPLPSQPNMAIDINLVSNSQTPPLPMATLLNPAGLPENTFWQIYAGFLWHQILHGND